MEIIPRVEEFAKKHCDMYKDDPGLYDEHVQLVRKYALILADIEHADKQIVEIAALLHDIGKYLGRDNHAEHSYKLAEEFLKGFPLANEKKKLILKCILKHSGKYSLEDNELEVKIMQCADGLGVIFDEKWQEYTRKTKTSEEILKLFDKFERKINLDSARKIAGPQLAKLKKQLNAK